MDRPAGRDTKVQLALEAKAQFLLGLRSRGIGDLSVLRAMETVPRELFVPHHYVDLANRDIAIPIACGQTMPEPFLVARMVEALSLRPDQRVLEIGAGSGYATSILARLSQTVMALERFQSLAIAASARLERLLIRNAEVIWGDGMAIGPRSGLFDRIVIHAVVDPVPENLLGALTEDGFMIVARPTAGVNQSLVRINRTDKDGLQEIILGSCRLRPLIPGLSQGT